MAWIEKYKPRHLNDLILNNKLKKQIDKVKYQNLLLTGGMGNGKTSTLYCIAKDLYKGFISEAVYVLDIIDDRSLKTIQDMLETFCKKRIEQKIKKMIIIDDLDEIPEKVQQLINNLMEIYEYKVIFSMSCFNLSNIIESIQSKCVILQFKSPKYELVENKLIEICNNEKIKYEKEGLKQIYSDADGNLRKTINNLQMISNFTDNITCKCVRQLLNIPEPTLIENIFKLCLDKNFSEANNKILDMNKNGTMSFDILNGMIQYLKTNDTIKEEIKIKFLEIVATSLVLVSKGFDSKLQLSNCIAKLII
jgi:replication factor C subunit 2/4